MEQMQEKKRSKTGVVILVLVVLLAVSAAGLGARYVYLKWFAPSQTVDTVPDNLIGEDQESDSGGDQGTGGGEDLPQPEGDGQESGGQSAGSGSSQGGESQPVRAAVVELYRGQAGDNQPFQVQGMLPGDSVSQYFCVKVSHDQAVALYFSPRITEQSQNLGDALEIRVTHLDSGEVLCDTTFSQADGAEFVLDLKESAAGESLAYYRVEVLADTSMGNEYQGAALQADFQWYIKDDGQLNPPTGDTAQLVLWMVAAVSSLGILALLFARRRRGDEVHG